MWTGYSLASIYSTGPYSHISNQHPHPYLHPCGWRQCLTENCSFFRQEVGVGVCDVQGVSSETTDCPHSMEGVSSQHEHPSVSRANTTRTDCLSVLYFNARSVLPKLDELFVAIEAYDCPDVICINTLQ